MLKYFLLLSMLKTVVLLNIFVETITLDQFNASLLNKSINFFKEILMTPKFWMVACIKNKYNLYNYYARMGLQIQRLHIIIIQKTSLLGSK